LEFQIQIFSTNNYLIFLSSLSSIVELKYKKALAITGAAIETPKTNVDALTVSPSIKVPITKTLATTAYKTCSP